MLNYELAKKILFRLDPEFAHNSTLQLAKKCPTLLSKLIPSGLNLNSLHTVDGLHLNWRFPLGIAAGLDKNAVALDYWNKLGFGSVEVGTVTLKPQLGNQGTRVFRYPANQSLRNSLGFPSDGLEIVKNRLINFRIKYKSSPNTINLGVNIGKNKESTFEESLEEYKTLYNALAPLADYMVINLSSPNTPGLRDFQKLDSVKIILESMKESLKQFKTPLFLKLSPDENLETYEQLFRLGSEHDLAGFVTTNTTIAHEWDKGGLSGKPLLEKNKELYFRFIEWGKEAKLDVILCGGFSKACDLLPYWEKGHRFFQVYTGFIYQGPHLLQEIERTLFNHH